MENSLFSIFDEIWPKAMYYGLWPNFGATLKIHNNSNFDWNLLEISTLH